MEQTARVIGLPSKKFPSEGCAHSEKKCKYEQKFAKSNGYTGWLDLIMCGLVL